MTTPLLARYFTIPPPCESRLPVSLARRVLERDGGVCVYCGAFVEDLQIDHVRPRAHFPVDAPPAEVHATGNLVTACEDCNSAKGPQNLEGFSQMLSGRGISKPLLRAMKERVRRALRRSLPPDDAL
jgi:5-methylcytosine-specific restriction endonuclease McrA